MTLFVVGITFLCGLLSQTVCRAAPGDVIVPLAIDLGPQNIAVLLTQTTSVTFPCCATDSSSSGARVQWWEHGTRATGNQISDGDYMSPYHPNAARYELHTDGRCYNLTINSLVSSDATKYVCRDLNEEDPSTTVQVGAQLVVLDDIPHCSRQLGPNEVAFEGAFYTMECAVTFSASDPIAPLMTWIGPQSYDVRTATTKRSVRSWISFVADRTMNGQQFTMTANFTSSGFDGTDMATNVPVWEYTWPSSAVFVNWRPNGMSVNPDLPSYEIGDILTFSTDANPAARYSWLAVDGPVAGTTWQGQTIQLTIAMVGQNTLRCRAENDINCAIFSEENYYNVTVNPFNACASSPCQSGGTCIRVINDYYCICIPGITGKNCDSVIRFCDSFPCLNGGTCVNQLNSYVCICDVSFTGTACESPVLPTSSEPTSSAPTDITDSVVSVDDVVSTSPFTV